MIGVNKYRPRNETPIDVLKVDNSAVRHAAAREARPAASASAIPAAWRRRSTRSTRGAGGGNGNLLELAVDAARAKATVGEISSALEKVFGRHRAEIKAISGVYKREVGHVRRRRSACSSSSRRSRPNEGRRPRILVAKIGQDGHDRGQKVIASAFADLGFDVDIGPLFATPGRSRAPGDRERRAHRRRVVARRRAPHAGAGAQGRARPSRAAADIMIVVGGVVPPQDYDALLKAGAAAIFPPGTVIAEAAEKLVKKLNRRLGEATE